MKTVLNYLGSYFRHVDKFLPLLCVGITVFDIFLVNSMRDYGFINQSTVKTQFIAAILGVAGAFVVSHINYRLLSKYWFVFAPVAVILQLLLFIPSLQVRREGADDIAWLNLGFTTIQPSEILKFVFIITLATHISKLGDKLNSLPQLLLVVAHGMFPAGLILLQGDAGSALVFVFIFLCMLFMAGLSWKYILAAVVAVPPVIFVAWNYIMQSHHRERILILFDKELQEQERLGMYLQQYNGTIALGSGQLTGLGFESENITYTPEIYNDFVFSYIGMTLGFIGCMTVVLVLAAICLAVLSNASGAQDKLGKLICVGVFAMVFFHCIVNIGMVLSVMPVIGIPLPFVSTGGTAMIMMHGCIGLVLSVSAHKEKEKHMFYTEKDKKSWKII